MRYDIRDYHGSVSGTQVSLYLIPGAENDDGQPQVFTWDCVGSGQPMPAFQGRWLRLGNISANCVAESLEQYLREHEDELLQIESRYKGSRWDGSNQIGEWDDDCSLFEMCDELVGGIEVDQYCDAGDWFTGGGVSLESFDAFESVREWAEAQVDEAAGCTPAAVLDVDEVEDYGRNWLTGRLNYVLPKCGFADEHGYDEYADEVSTIRKLLCMREQPTIEDGWYFIHPCGSNWIAVAYRKGKYVDRVEECSMGTHVAARDEYAGLWPSDDDREVPTEIGDAIVREVMGEETHLDMVFVTRVKTD